MFQFVFSLCSYLLPWRRPELIEGAGSVRKLPALIRQKGIGKVLVVTDAVLMKIGLLGGLFDAMKAASLAYVVFDGVEPNPSIENIEAALKVYRENGCEAIVAFGGGSSMDCAKACGARVVKPNQSVMNMGGLLRVHKRLPLLFAIPTTAGTGSETTIAAIVTDRSTHHKYAINDLVLIPRYAVLDPELTIALPPHITSTTGLDALTHAVEAYTNRYAPRYTQDLSEKAVKLIFENLEAVYRDGKNIEARSRMLTASFYAGAAFTRAGVGYVHAIAHTLGGLYGVPHGLANAVILPYMMERYGASVYRKLARLAGIVGIEGADEKEKAEKFIAEIYRMNRDMNIPAGFDCIRDGDIPQMVTWAMAEANPVYNVPKIWGREELTAAVEGIRLPRKDA